MLPWQPVAPWGQGSPHSLSPEVSKRKKKKFHYKKSFVEIGTDGCLSGLFPTYYDQLSLHYRKNGHSIILLTSLRIYEAFTFQTLLLLSMEVVNVFFVVIQYIHAK